jgi:hypothetical protein
VSSSLLIRVRVLFLTEESPAAEADTARVLSSMYEVSAVASRVWFLRHRFRRQFVGNFSTFTITEPGLGGWWGYGRVGLCLRRDPKWWFGWPWYALTNKSSVQILKNLLMLLRLGNCPVKLRVLSFASECGIPSVFFIFSTRCVPGMAEEEGNHDGGDESESVQWGCCPRRDDNQWLLSLAPLSWYQGSQNQRNSLNFGGFATNRF